MKIILAVLGLAFWIISSPVSGQSARDLYQSAQQHAHAGEYQQAKENLNTILLSNARHYDARLLLAQVYAWDGDYALALSLLSELIHNFTPTADAYEMFARVKKWQEDYPRCLQACEAGLGIFPGHTPLRLLKASALIELDQREQAKEVLLDIITNDSEHAEANQLLKQLQHQGLKNAVTLEYHHSRFNNTFTPWHRASLGYRRNATWGSVTARVNYAYMFDQIGNQYALDTYPKFGKKSYAYINAAISDNIIFPKLRLGAEYFRLFPGRFEASAGISSLNFAHTQVYLYTLQLGHYFNNYWISTRGFMASIDHSNQFTGSLTLRRYIGHQDHYFTLYATSGSTPLQVISLNEIRRLNAHTIAVDYQYPALKETLLIKAKAEYQQETYEEIRNTGRFTISFSLEKRF